MPVNTEWVQTCFPLGQGGDNAGSAELIRLRDHVLVCVGGQRAALVSRLACGAIKPFFLGMLGG